MLSPRSLKSDFVPAALLGCTGATSSRRDGSAHSPDDERVATAIERAVATQTTVEDPQAASPALKLPRDADLVDCVIGVK